MASLATLCRVCHWALYAERCSLANPQNVYVYESHHAPSWTWASLDGPVRPRFVVALSALLVSISAVTLGKPRNITTVDHPGCAADHVCLHIVGSLTLSTKHQHPMHCALRPDILGITLGVPGPFFSLPLQTAHYESTPGSLGQHDIIAYATEVSCILLEPVLCTEPVVYRRVGHCVAVNPEDISRLGLQVDESGLASAQDRANDIEIVII